MKSVLVILLLFVSGTSFSQIKIGIEKADSCYKKGQARAKNRFAEWECGKIAGVVDCNEKLEMDPNSGVVLTSGNHQPFTGTCETCHMNGMKERTVHFVNGRTEGIDTTTYKSGCYMVIRSHVQGVEHGTWTYFYDSTGYVNWEKNYNMGALHGPQITYSKNGDTLKFENYVDGKLEGAKYTYAMDPKTKHTYVSKKVTYKQGLLDGPFLVYNPDRKIIEETSFKQGKKHGVFKYYYDDGVLLRTENWDMDVRNGEFKYLYYNGDLQSVENYKKGKLEGWVEERFPDQKVKRRALYAKGVLVEEHVFDQLGKEIKTFGGSPSSGKEDDAMPGTKPEKKKKEKKKKEKKPETPKEETPKTEGQ